MIAGNAAINLTADETAVEDILEVSDIQGNALAGFNKDHQIFLFAAIADVPSAKKWLSDLVPSISTVSDVLPHNREFSRLRKLMGADPFELKATWVNVAFSAPGLTKLKSAAAVSQFSTTFVAGLHVSSALLGDPTDPTSSGHPTRWVIGGPNNIADIVIIIAADDLADLESRTLQLRSSMFSPAQGSTSPFAELFEQRCDTRPDLKGHEHFGFKDGISQPAVRGRISEGNPADFLSPRLIDPIDPRAKLFSKPGHHLVWPGQFVIGYRRQDSHDVVNPAPAAMPTPGWAKNGSYVVVRRLKQDVTAFWRFVADVVSRLAKLPGFSGIREAGLASLLVGRWPSGAPLMRAPQSDNPALASDGYANNNFLFKDSSSAVPLIGSVPYVGDHFVEVVGDFPGAVCPHAAHIRKANPRDLPTDTGGKNDTLTRLVLRRGIPFGAPVLDPLSPTAVESATERGLMFVSYQASIKNQFEFLVNHWANVANQPQSGGLDPIIGQQFGQNGINRRIIEIIGTDGNVEPVEVDVTWITPTGGGYFFAPSVSALRDELCR